MEIKAVFFDIDGTLINDSRTVLKSTEKAIHSLKEQGILVGLATGRGPFFVRPFMEQLQLDFAVTYNGQYIFSRDKVISATPIDKQHLQQLIAYARKNRKEIALGTRDGVFGSRIMSFGLSPVSQWSSRFVPKKLVKSVTNGFNRLIGKVVPQNTQELSALSRQPIYQVLMLATPQESEQVAEQFPELKFTRSSPYASDIINQGTSKLEGIKRIGEEFGFDISQVMAFGDSDNDLEMLSGVGLSIAMGNGTSKVKEIAKHTTSSNSQDGIHRALEHFGILASEKVFVSSDPHFNKVKEFHGLMDESTQEEPIVWSNQDAIHRADFKLEELVEFVQAASQGEEEFDAAIRQLHAALDKAQTKVKSKKKAEVSLTGQVDALIDLLYFTYGSFALMGVDPERIFDIVHQANMGKIFPDGKAHFDPVTHKILKPDDWEEKYAPEPAIKAELERQIRAYQRNQSIAAETEKSQS
ncbi:Cof-type HAD-IIB family hydrolase [Streptococcus massiliensis]|uniref:Cof family protein n=1 Tax=Streptococcus massiliensis TaxID=313439 RepID=A0A380L0E8_9STRE|nr:Cof-type HAD-IIB family hydrolase [Streptococcus massiliensis]SUN77282.1 Cof family protein [Streptococcus massiliensis]